MKCFLALVFCFAAVLASRRQSSPELVRQYENKVISKSLSDTGSSSYRSSNIKDKQASFHEVCGGFNSKEEPIPKLLTSSSNNMPGNILSNIALVCGTTVGAGILALPSVAAAPGFFPSTAGLFVSWLFMLSTGLLIAEVNCQLKKLPSFKKTDGDDEDDAKGVLVMTKYLLGDSAAAACGLIYVFIHYTLLIAYIVEAGNILADVLHLSGSAGPLLFAASAGGLLAFGSQSLVESVNNFLVLVVLTSFGGLVSLQIPGLQIAQLFHPQDYSAVLPAVPVMFVALVYHNIVPTICSALKYDRKKITIALTAGTFIPLVMFIVWIGVSLGSSSMNAGSISSSRVLVQLFSEAAIVTSFIGFVIGLMGFLKDVFPTTTTTTSLPTPPTTTTAENRQRDTLLYSLVLLPPTVIAAISDPSIFLKALDVAGTYGISILFGILPVLLAYKARLLARDTLSTKKQDGEAQDSNHVPYEQFIPGGLPSLLALSAFTVFVVVQKILY